MVILEDKPYRFMTCYMMQTWIIYWLDMNSVQLMQQMDLREQLDDAHTAEALDEISAESTQLARDLLQKIEQQLDGQQDWPGAAQSVRALMFLDKLAADIDRRHETLETR